MRGTASRADPYGAALQRRLELLTRQAPELNGAAAVQQAMLPLLRAASAEQAAPDFDADLARRSLAAGRPILADQDVAFDPEAARQQFCRLARATESVLAREAKRPVTQIRQAAEKRRLDLSALWQSLAAGDGAGFDALAAGAELDGHWLRLLGESTLKPPLRALRAAAGRSVDFSGWQRGLCPVCGSLPLLSEVQDKAGARRLRCGMCAAAWPYPRLTCAFCANKNPRQMGTLSLPNEAEKYWAQTCEACRGYVKTVVSAEAIADDLLAVEDLATLHLDDAAADRRYSRAPIRA
jgi:FdhE protein